MFNNILFVGGIHGVGKSTLCSKICSDLGLNHLTASSLLKWHEIKEDIKDKKVDNIDYTQERLIQGLEQTIIPSEKYLLEGHLTLFDREGKISEVPTNIFQKISPVLISVITEDPGIIKSRIESRDGNHYDLNSLSEMQNVEVSRGEMIAQILQVPFCRVVNSNTDKLIELIETKFTI